MREKQPKQRIVGSDSPPEVGHKLKPQDGRVTVLRQYRTEKEKEKTRLGFVLAGADASGELTIAPTLWKAWKGLLFERVVRDGFITANNAIHELARILKDKFGFGSSVTTRRYLKEIIGDNEHGDYLKKWHSEFGWIVVFSDRMEKRLASMELDK